MPINPSAANPTAKQIRMQRDRILASKVFSRSKRQSAFLEYVIDAHLEGRTDQLKEYTLGIDVFGRDESFDPTVESIVRVEAGRLRSKLREYYGGQGRRERVLIEIPKGHYVPVFQLIDAPVIERRARPGRWLWAGMGVALLVIAVSYFVIWSPMRQSVSPADALQLPPPSSIAVLPLRDWSEVPEEYFSVAITDALISSLAEIRALRVTSLTSVMRFSNTETPIPEIGQALGVAYIVEGSVDRNDERVRITTQLISADADEQVWSNTIERPLSDLLSAQSEVTTAIAARISDELLPPHRKQSGRPNEAAYEAYMKGRYFHNRFTAEGFNRSMQFLQEAIEIEPDYAEAYAALASCHCLLAGHGLEMVSPVLAIPQARTLAMKALSLDTELAEPNAFIGIINFKYEWDTEGALAMLNRAIELNPSLYQAYLWQSQVMEALGRHEDAVSRARDAKQLNPLSLAANLNLGWQLFQAGQYIEAESEIDDLIEFDSDFWGGHWAKGQLHLQHKMYDKAIREFKLAASLDGGHSLPLSALGHAYATAGMHEKAREVISELEALSRDVYVSPFHIAVVYAGLNEPDSMFLWLERAFAVRARSIAWMHVEREMEPFLNDSRFQDLLERVGIHTVGERNH